MTSLKKQCEGFTLIELLIVVAIIAILAAIAVPNFLEAQVRSKTARVKSDMRAIGIACEAYMVEHNEYPPDQDNNPFSRAEPGFRMLTTPIAFLSMRPTDPFSRPFNAANPNADDVQMFYAIASGSDALREADRGPAFAYPARYIVQCYFISSFGPDQIHDSDNDDFPFDTNLRSYDPTNGTVSSGDMFRFGGDYMAGNWRLNGRDHRLWGSIPVTLP